MSSLSLSQCQLTDSWIYRLTCRASRNTGLSTISMRSSITTAAFCTVTTRRLPVARQPRPTRARKMSSVIGIMRCREAFLLRLLLFLVVLQTIRMALHGRSSSARHFRRKCRDVCCLPVALPKTSRAARPVCQPRTAQLQRSRGD